MRNDTQAGGQVMNRQIRSIVGLTAVAIIIGAGIPEVFALGFRNPDQGAAATAQGNAFVAQADDATAVYYNPAGLTQFHGTEIYNGGDFFFPDNKLKGGGSDAEMTSWSLTPHLYASSDLGMTNSPWRFGIGANVPFGNQAVFSHNGPFKYSVTSDSLQVFNIQPTVAYRFNEHLSLGAGLNVYDAFTALNNRLPPISPLLPEDGRFHFDASGIALGATVGAMWKITPQHTVGIVYRSPFTVNFNGTADVNYPGIVKQSKSAQTSIPFPQIVTIGYAFRPIPKLKLEADVDWTDWQTLNNVVLHAPGSSVNNFALHFNWMDSFMYEFGAQYDLNEHWKLRGGFIYSEDSVPNNTFSASVPDSNRYVFNVGFGYTTGRFTLDAVYQYTIADDRTVSNGAADGTWRISANALMITMGAKF
jgi:long-chain fatty acid transport protein